MTKRGITMNQKETGRVGVTQSTVAKRTTQRQAAEQLGLSVCQIKRRGWCPGAAAGPRPVRWPRRCNGWQSAIRIVVPDAPV